MLRIGLTGGIASGKSTAAKLFAAHGVPIIDCDLIARELTELGSPALQAFAERFGHEVIAADGSLDRRALRERVFKDPVQKKWLEDHLHPLIRQEIKRRLALLDTPYCLIVIPLLSEAQGIDFIDRVWVVDCLPELQLRRLQERDHCSLEEAQNTINLQHSREQRLSLAQDVIQNDGEIQSLIDQVDKLHRQYWVEARTHP